MEVLGYHQQRESETFASVEGGVVISANNMSANCSSAQNQQQRFKIVKIDRRVNNEGKIRDDVTGKITYKRGRWTVVDYYDVLPAPVTAAPTSVVTPSPAETSVASVAPVANAVTNNHVTPTQQSQPNQPQNGQQPAHPPATPQNSLGNGVEPLAPTDEIRVIENGDDKRKEKESGLEQPESHQAATDPGTLELSSDQNGTKPGHMQLSPSLSAPPLLRHAPENGENGAVEPPVLPETNGNATIPQEVPEVIEKEPVVVKEEVKEPPKNVNHNTVAAIAHGNYSVAIDNKIEQAMDLVKSHLMFAVREEVDVLKERIVELLDRIQVLEQENSLLRNSVPSEVLSSLKLNSQPAPQHHHVQSQPPQVNIPEQLVRSIAPLVAPLQAIVPAAQSAISVVSGPANTPLDKVNAEQALAP